MIDASFEKIGQSSRPLYGERKLLLCGFAPPAQSKFKTLLAMIGMAPLPLVWASGEDGDTLVEGLMRQPDGHGQGTDSPWPRAIIMGGILESELHQLMSGCRQAGMQQALWATLTPTSGQWPLKRLLTELSAEREAMAKIKR
jgi:hypothetical protein